MSFTRTLVEDLPGKLSVSDKEATRSIPQKKTRRPIMEDGSPREKVPAWQGMQVQPLAGNTLEEAPKEFP